MKAETKVLVYLCACLLLMEVISRWMEPKLSADLRNILSHKEIPLQIWEDEKQGRTSILVVGNSLARACIDASILEREFEVAGFNDPRTYFLTPDASGVNEWTAAYRKYFLNSNATPDFLFVVTGPGHLLDQQVRSPEKLAAFHSRIDDWPELMRRDLQNGNERARFLLAGFSRLFANRERVRPLLFYRFVPGFEETAQRLNQTEGVFQGDVSGTANTFERLLESSAAQVDEIAIVAAPLPEPYSLPIEIERAALDSGACMLKEGASQSWSDDSFPDGYHLGSKEAGKFTAGLIRNFIQWKEE